MTSTCTDREEYLFLELKYNSIVDDYLRACPLFLIIRLVGFVEKRLRAKVPKDELTDAELVTMSIGDCAVPPHVAQVEAHVEGPFEFQK